MPFLARLDRLRGKAKRLLKRPESTSSPATSVASLPNAPTPPADINPVPTPSAVEARTTVNTPDIPPRVPPVSHNATQMSPSQVENEGGQSRPDELASQAQVASSNVKPVSDPANNSESGLVHASSPLTGAPSSPPNTPTPFSLTIAQEDPKKEQHKAPPDLVLPSLQVASSTLDTLDPPSKLEATTPNSGPTRTWKSLSAFRGVVDRVSGGFGPLKPVLDDLSDLIGIYEDAAAAEQEYAALKSDLEALFSTLSEHFSSDVPPVMTAGMSNLCTPCETTNSDAIEIELDTISSKKERGTGRRYPEANKDIQDVMKCYRRIQGHLERLKLNADLNMWRVVDELAADNRLRSLSPSLSACYDSAEASIVGRRECTPETRKQVLNDISSWTHDKQQGNMYWLNGMAGTGKTTISNSLCTMLDRSHELGASFFCSRSLPECRNVKFILPTIAYQLACFSRPFYYALSLALQRDRDLHTKVLSSQFAGLIARPLQQVADTLPSDVVLVIDALDECDDIQGVKQLLELLARHASDLPVKLFVSSRPEPQIRQKIGRTKSQLILHELESSIVQEDIRLYLHTELHSLVTCISEAELATLVERAGVLFIYAATVVRYIQSAGSGPLQQKRVQSVLGANTPGYSNKSKDIDALYTIVLASAFENPDVEEAEKDVMKLVLDTVVCAQEPLTLDGLAGILGLEDRTWVQAALEPLWSVIHVSGEEGVVSTLHASFPDFMLDPTRCKTHGCQGEKHHDRLAELCFNRIESNKPTFNVCGLESSFICDKDVPDLEEKISRTMPLDLSYACYYWAAHLALGGYSDERAEQLRAFLSNRLLLWMEVLNLKDRISTSASMVMAARVWCQAPGTSQEIKELIHDAWRFATTFATNGVNQSTPHLYASMLASWPSPGPVSDHYHQRTRVLTSVRGPGMERRQLALLSALSVGSRVLAVAFSPDGMRIVSGSSDNTVRVWDATTGKPAMDTLKGHTGSVNSVAFSPNSMRIVSGSSDNTVRVWDATTGKPAMSPLEGHTWLVNSVAFSPDGMRIVSGSSDKAIRVWDATTGKPAMAPLERHTYSVNSVAFSSDGMRIVSGSSDNTVRVWNATTGKPAMPPLEGHTKSVNSVLFSPDGMRIVSGSDDNTIRVWDATTGKPAMSPLGGYTGFVYSVALSSDGMRIVSSLDDHTIRVRDATTGKPAMDPLEGHTGSVKSAAFSPDGMRIVSGSDDNTIRVWDATTRKSAMSPLEGHTGLVYSVALSPDSMRIVSGSHDNTVRVWDAMTGKPAMDPLKGNTYLVNTVAFSSDGMRIVSGTYYKTLRVWNATTGRLGMDTLEGHTESVNSVAFSFDGMRIVSGSDDETLRVWDATTGKPAMAPLKGHTSSVRSVTFSPDGMRIVSGSSDKTIRVWDATTGKPAMSPLGGHTRSVNSVALSPDGMRIVSGSSDKTIRVWDAITGKPAMDPLKGHTGSVNSVAFSSDGMRIVSGSSDNTVRVWDATTGKPAMSPLEGHTGLVNSVAFSSDGMRIVSGSFDNTIRAWNLGVQVSKLNSDDPSPQAVNRSWTLDQNGWVRDAQNRLLLWLPVDLRHRLLRPKNSFLISSEGSVELDFAGAQLGESWAECYVPA